MNYLSCVFPCCVLVFKRSKRKEFNIFIQIHYIFKRAPQRVMVFLLFWGNLIEINLTAISYTSPQELLARILLWVYYTLVYHLFKT